MSCTKFAFAGFRHGHIFALYNALKGREDARIVGCWEADPAAKAEAEAKGVVFTYDTLEQLLADPQVDVVAIGDYFAARGGIALRALQAGKHVLADKPLCTSRKEAEAIAKEAAASGLAVGIMLDFMDNSSAVTAMDAVRRGMLGKINNISMNGQHPLLYGSRPGWYYEEGKHCGVINDIAIHAVDACRLFTECDVAEVVGARCWNFYADQEPRFEDSAQLLLRMENGAGIMADVSYAVPDAQLYSLPAYWHVRIWGQLGMLEFGINQPQVTFFSKYEAGTQVLPMLPVEKTYLDTYLEALAEPEKIAALNKRNIASTIQTLWVQEVADGI